MNNDSLDDYKAEIKKAEQLAIKKFDENCEKIAKNEPKQHQEWKYVNEFGFANTFTGRWK